MAQQDMQQYPQQQFQQQMPQQFAQQQQPFPQQQQPMQQPGMMGYGGMQQQMPQQFSGMQQQPQQFGGMQQQPQYPQHGQDYGNSPSLLCAYFSSHMWKALNRSKCKWHQVATPLANSTVSRAGPNSYFR
eukprot:EC725673.1.p1 GENE.EC725673.1~~EC725673.1.p1  ORF type:complete len:130 (-),score=31.87 EC725673.1:298-687(-)